MSSQKTIVLAVWFLSGLAMWLGGGLVGTLGTVLFGFLVVAHAIECVVFLKELREAPGSLGSQLVQVFLFGVVHMQELRGGAGTTDADA